MVLHGSGHVHPWVLLTDTPPDRTEATLYACRDWIEQGFRGLKRAGWQWQRTRRTDPVRAGRHWLVMAVATLLAVAYSTRREKAAALGRNPAQLRTPPARSLWTVGRPRPGPGALTRAHPRHEAPSICPAGIVAAGRLARPEHPHPVPQLATQGPGRRRTAFASAVHPSHPEPHMYLSTGRAPSTGRSQMACPPYRVPIPRYKPQIQRAHPRPRCDPGRIHTTSGGAKGTPQQPKDPPTRLVE